jgi:DNA-binding XRE family transcriptional regulator
MSGHTKTRHISAHSYGSVMHITHHHKSYSIPKNIFNKYAVENEPVRKAIKHTVPASIIFEKLIKKYTKAGALLKGLRGRENLTQAAFAKKINVTQANLSKMENGKRPIGKTIAKRIEKAFGTDFRYFLE